MYKTTINSVFAILSVVVSDTAARSLYFANDLTGDDRRSYLQASNPESPWKTFKILDTFEVKPGDKILLKRGSVWRSTLKIKNSGEQNNPIVISSFGNPDLPFPEIKGTDSLVGFKEPTGYWSTTLGGGVIVKSVFVQNKLLPVSRYPSSGWVNGAKITNKKTIQLPQQMIGGSWIGGSAHLRTRNWTLESYRIIDQVGSTITLDDSTVYNSDSFDLYVTNTKVGFSSGRWFQNEAAKTLNWRATSSENYDAIEASIRKVGVDLKGVDHIQIQELKIFGTTEMGVYGDGIGITISNCEFLYPGLYGVLYDGKSGMFSGNTFRGAANHSISANGTSNSVVNNKFRRNGFSEWLGPDGMGKGCCGGATVSVVGDSGVIAKNDIDTSGYNGITFRGANSKVDSNIVRRSCVTTDDCGGIYTWTGKYASIGSKGSVIRHNIVQFSTGAASQGIYLDDGSHDIKIENNVISDNTVGISLHNNQNILVFGNVSYGNKYQLHAQHDTLAGKGDMHSNRVESNVFVAKYGQYDTASALLASQQQPMVQWDSNFHCFDLALMSRCWRNRSVVWDYENSIDTSAALGAETQRRIYLGATASENWTTSPDLSALNVVFGLNSCRQNNDTCLRVKHPNPGQNVKVLINGKTVFPVAESTYWRLSFFAKGKIPGQQINAILRRSNGDYAPLGSTSIITLDTAWRRYSLLVFAKISESNARLDFQSHSKDSAYWIDEISFRTIKKSVIDTLPIGRLAMVTPKEGIIGPTSSDLRAKNWVNHNNEKVEISSNDWFKGHAIFPKGVPIVSPKKILVTNYIGVQTARIGERIAFRGLIERGYIYDLHGKLIATIDGNDRGEAVWSPDDLRQPRWMLSGGKTTYIAPNF